MNLTEIIWKNFLHLSVIYTRAVKIEIDMFALADWKCWFFFFSFFILLGGGGGGNEDNTNKMTYNHISNFINCNSICLGYTIYRSLAADFKYYKLLYLQQKHKIV